MKKSIWQWGFTLLFISFGVAACNSPKSTAPGDDNDGPILNIPENFNFETTRGVFLQIDANTIQADRVIVGIYSDNPTKGGVRLQQVNVDGGSNYKTLLTLPTYMESIWVEAMDTKGFIQSHLIDVYSDNVSVNLRQVFTASQTSLQSSEDCNTGCDFFPGDGMVVIDGNQTYCVAQGDVWNGQLSFENDGGKFKTCGEANFTSNMAFVNSPNNVEVYITDTGSLSGTSMNFGSNPATVINYGDVSFTHNLNGGDMLYENVGTSTFGGLTVRIANSSTLINDGTFHVTGPEFQSRGTVVNNGTITVDNNYDLRVSGYELDNQCTIEVGGDFITSNHTGTISNSGFINVANTVSLDANNTFNVGNFSYVLSNILNADGSIVGPTLGNYGRFDAMNSFGSSIGATASVTNRVDICDLNDMTVDGAATIDGSVTVCDAYIPPTPCTPEVGSLPPDDEFPGDPFRIYNNPFPAPGVYGTLMFEDLWPSFGDYDMNDLVIAYNINLITNLQNEVVDVVFEMVIRALGAAFDSGFGIELPVDPSRVQSVTGARYTNPGQISVMSNGVEAGQSNAVIILWDDSAYEMGIWANTTNPANHIDEDYLTVTATFDPPVPMADLGTVPFNPFIYINNERGREVHLPGYEPTDLADPSFFDTFDDTTDPTIPRYYKSDTELNWAINVPILIPYPLEKVNIMDAYNKFQSWAESGGTVDTDWYVPFSGYRNIPNMYIGPDLTPPAPFGPPPIPGPPTPGN